MQIFKQTFEGEGRVKHAPFKLIYVLQWLKSCQGRYSLKYFFITIFIWIFFLKLVKISCEVRPLFYLSTNLFIFIYTKKFGVGKFFLSVFEKSVLFLPKLHLFDQNYSNVVKYYYNLKFSILI